jgi:ElaB/YqjD/DUF883 family membrane-anchored ribosome-binding protein
MSQNRPDNENDFGGASNTGGSSAGTGTQAGGGSYSAGTGTSAGGGGYSAGTGGSAGSGLSTTGGGAATGTATAPSSGGIGARAKEYGESIAEKASQAREYITERASVVGDKLQDLRNVDYAEYANQAKDYARQNPGQALLVAAAAGFVIGLLVRGGRR